jgi:hypothetical protein
MAAMTVGNRRRLTEWACCSVTDLMPDVTVSDVHKTIDALSIPLMKAFDGTHVSLYAFSFSVSG